MFFDDEDDDEFMQRIKNMAFLNFWGTNEEREEFMDSPVSAIILVVIIIALVLLVSC
jgi:hypothetical protein